jgi:MFS family permease
MAEVQNTTHQESLNLSKIKLVTSVSLLFGFADAFLIYLLSIYFREAAGTDNVGVFYLVSYVVGLVPLLCLHVFVRKMGRSLFLLLMLLFLVTTDFLITMAPMSWVGAGLVMLHLILMTLVWVSIDMVLESFSTDRASGRIRGIHLTVVNLGWVFAPLLATRVVERFGFDAIFVIELLLHSLIFVVVLAGLRGVNHRFEGRIRPWEIVRKVERKPNIMRIYHVSFTLEMFYALMIIYLPIHLSNVGVTLAETGLIYTAMLSPFVFLQYPLGLLADKRFGEKPLLIATLFLMGVTTTALVFVTVPMVWVWALLLLLTRIGAASVEVLRDSYFYKRIDGREVDVIEFFRTARPVAYIVSAILSGVLLWGLPGQVDLVFVMIGVACFLGVLSAIRLENNKVKYEQDRLPIF